MRLRVYIVLLGMVAIPLGILARNPLSFQKNNSIRLASGPIAKPAPSAFEIVPFIAGIPYEDSPRATYVVEPQAKYEIAIREGVGNCSNLTFAAAHHLEQEGVDFQIVHLMPRDGFLSGRGHTVLRMGYRLDGESRVGVVDMLAGALPVSGGVPVDVDALARGPIPDFEFLRMNRRNENEAEYYGDFLTEMDLGFIMKSDVVRYFRFLEAIYVPLGSRKIEKYLYDGFAMLVGVYPRTWVESFDLLYENHRAERWLMILCLWTLRVSALVIPTLLMTDIVRLMRRRAGLIRDFGTIHRPD